MTEFVFQGNNEYRIHNGHINLVNASGSVRVLQEDGRVVFGTPFSPSVGDMVSTVLPPISHKDLGYAREIFDELSNKVRSMMGVYMGNMEFATKITVLDECTVYFMTSEVPRGLVLKVGPEATVDMRGVGLFDLFYSNKHKLQESCASEEQSDSSKKAKVVLEDPVLIPSQQA